MAATLKFHHTYAATVGATTTVTVLGEDSGDLLADYTVDVTVTPAQMNNLLKVTSEGNPPANDPDTQAYPTLLFDMVGSGFKAAMEGVGLGSPSDSTTLAAYAAKVDGSVYSYSNLTNIEDSWVLAIPHEAIKAVSNTPPAPSWDGIVNISAPNDVAADVITTSQVAVRDLFEQAIAAERFNISGAGTTFVAGDKIEMVVSFSMSNSRIYQLDADLLNTPSMAGVSFNIGGQTYSLPANGKTITSNANVKSIKYVFTARGA